MNRQPFKIYPFIIAKTALIVMSFAVTAPAMQDDSDGDNLVVFESREESLVSGLRARGLYEIAQQQCQQLLSRAEVSKTDVAAITVERLRIQTAKSLTTASSVRKQQTTRIDEIASDFSAAQRGNPRQVLVTVQHGLSHLAVAKLLRQELAAQYGDDSAQQTGIDHLTKARTILKRAFDETVRLQSSQRNRATPKDGLTESQLQTLVTNVQYQLAVTNLVSARFYDLPAAKKGGSNDRLATLNRIDSLNMVAKQLASVRLSVSETKTLWWQTWIDEIACQRMLGNVAQADQILKRMRSSQRPQSTNAALIVEEIELAVSLDDGKRMQVLADRAAKLSPKSAELDVALIQLLVTLGRIEQAASLTRVVEAKHGSYWARRAELALLSGDSKSDSPQANSTVSAAESSQLLRFAEQAEKNGNLENAIKGYLSVAASQLGRGDEADGLATIVRAGKLFEQQKEHVQAANLFLDRSLKASEQPIAASIHLRGCWNLTQVAAAELDQLPGGAASFQQRLQEHVRTWPQAQSSNQARYWLGADLVKQTQYESATEALRQVDPASVHFTPAVALIRFANRQQLMQLENDSKPVESTARRMLQQYEQMLDSAPSAQRPQLVSAMASLAFAWNAEPTEDSIRRIRGAIADRAASETPAELLLFSSLAEAVATDASDENFQTSLDRSFAKPISDINAAELLRTVDRMLPNFSGQQSSRLNQIKLETANKALLQTKSAALRKSYSIARAQSLAAMGRTSEAIKDFQKLLTQDENNLTAKAALARLLSVDPSQREIALSQWRSIASRTKPQSEIWFEAKLNVAKILVAENRKDDAQKMLRYLQAVPPGWDQSTFKTAFDELLRECSK